MIPFLVVGAGFGLALFGILVHFVPPRPSVLVQLGRFDAMYYGGAAPARARLSQPGDADSDQPGNGAQLRLGRWLTGELNRRGIGYHTLRQDVALSGQSWESVLGRKLFCAMVGFLLGLLALVVAQFDLGFALPFGSPLLVGLLVAAVMFFVPDIEIRKGAELRRWEFRHALLVYMDLVALNMSANKAPPQAMADATAQAGCWPVVLIRTSLFRAARTHRRQGWAALSDLGERIGVVELRDLGLAMRGVADDGAKVRETLVARAATLREHLLAEEEGLASERSQSMKMAQILVGVGLMIFISYPAMATVFKLPV